MSINLKKMAQHGIQNVLMQQDHGLAYSEVLEFTHQVSAAVLYELQQRINLNMSNGVQGDPDIEKGEPIINVGLKSALHIIEEVKNEIHRNQ